MWTAIIAGGAALAGGALSANASKNAAGQQTGASDRAIAQTDRQFNLSRDDLAQYRNAGNASLSRLSGGLGLNRAPSSSATGFIPREQFDSDAYLAANPDVAKAGVDAYTHYLQFGTGEGRQGFKYGEMAGTDGGSLTRKFTMDDFQNDPVNKASFDFGLSEGEKAVNRMFGSRGLARSGAAIKAATRFATDYAGSKAGESRQRFVEDQNNEFAKLSGVSGTGQAATTATGALGSQASGSIGDMIVGGGNARGAASIAGGNAYAGALNNIGNQVSGQYTLDRILNRGNTTTAQPVSPMVPGQFSMDTYG